MTRAYSGPRVLEFRVLGPLEASGPSGPVSLGRGKQRLLLAVLVLQAGETVSRNAIIDALWPEQPPPTATHTLESYASRLRAALRAAGAEPEVIESHPAGYRLRRAGNVFDSDVFTERARAARQALEHGDARAASDLAHDALAGWRGPALAGLEDEQGVRGAAAALEDGRLEVLEIRAEAELALGHHARAVAELRASASDHPARERLHELLMLALYRAGRQADALEVYRRVCIDLDRRLGLEPRPTLRELQAKVLRHDPTLDFPDRAGLASDSKAGATAATRPRPSRRRRLAVLIGLAAPLAATLAVAGFLLADDGTVSGATQQGLHEPALGTFDPSGGRALKAVALGAVPSRIAAGLGAQWATSYDNGTLLRIDPNASTVVQTVRVGHGATGVAVAAGDIWVADALDNRLTRVDAETNEVVQQIRVGASPQDLAAGAGTVWVTNAGDGTVTRVDPQTGAVRGSTRVGPSPHGVAVGHGSVWVALTGGAAVARLDLRHGRLLQRIHVGTGPSAIAVGRAGVWVVNTLDSTVSLIDPDTGTVVLTRALSGAATSLAAVEEGVWIGTDTAKLALLSASGRLRTVSIPSPTSALATSRTGLLVGLRGGAASHRGGTLVVRVADPAARIDPADCCDLPPNIRMLAYDSLLAYSKSPASPGTLVPDLALAIPAAADGGRSYTFRLRPGLRYSTGAPVLAADFRRGLERAAHNSDIYAGYISALPGALACPRKPRCDLRSAVRSDDRAGTLTLRLTHPDSRLLLALGLPVFAPAPAGHGIRPGTGPYRIARTVPGHLIDFERNPSFREWAPTAQPAGYPDRIIVQIDGTPSAHVTAVMHDHADYTFDAPTPDQLRAIQLTSPSRLHRQPLPNTDEVELNTRSAPFDDVRVRRALNYAVDRAAIANLYGGLDNATPTCQSIPATIPGHVPYCPYTRNPSRRGRWMATDLPRARRLIAASGTRGEAVTVLTTSGTGPYDEPVAGYVVHLLNRLGYRARLRSLTPSRAAAALNDYRHPPQVVTFAWIGDLPTASQFITDQFSCAAWHPPTRLNNHAEFCDPTIDRWATRAAGKQLTDPVAANRLWALADRRLTDLAPSIPTITETATDLVSRRVGNYQYIPTIGALLDQLWLH